MSLTSQSRETPPCHACQRLLSNEQAREDKVLTRPPDSTDPSTTEHLQDVPEQAKSTETPNLKHKEPHRSSVNFLLSDTLTLLCPDRSDLAANWCILQKPWDFYFIEVCLKKEI